MKHTPGPWFVNGPFDNESDLFIRATDEGENFDIANLSVDETGKANANAKLIAAAPDLLEALKKAEETILRLSSELNYTSRRWSSEHLDPIRNAIKKATQ